MCADTPSPPDKETETAPKLPTSKDVIEGIKLPENTSTSTVSRSEREYQKRFNRDAVDSQLQYEHLKGIRDHYSHKGKWSWFLMGAIGGMLLFQSYLLLKVGSGKLDFSEYEWLLPALLVQNLGQVIGLAVYAVKYLFSDISQQKPK